MLYGKLHVLFQGNFANNNTQLWEYVTVHGEN